MTELTYTDMIGIRDLVGEDDFNRLQTALLDKFPFYSKCFGEIVPDPSVYPDAIVCVFCHPLGLEIEYDEPNDLIFCEYDLDEEVDKSYIDILREHINVTGASLPASAYFMSLEPLIYDMLPYELENKGVVFHKHKDKTGAVNYIYYNTGEVLFSSDHNPDRKDLSKQNVVYTGNPDFTEIDLYKSTVDTKFDEVGLFLTLLNSDMYLEEIKNHISSCLMEELW